MADEFTRIPAGWGVPRQVGQWARSDTSGASVRYFDGRTGETRRDGPCHDEAEYAVHHAPLFDEKLKEVVAAVAPVDLSTITDRDERARAAMAAVESGRNLACQIFMPEAAREGLAIHHEVLAAIPPEPERLSDRERLAKALAAMAAAERTEE